MLNSWEIPLVKAGLKKLQMPSWWSWVLWLCFCPASKGLLGMAMGFWGHLLGWAFLKAPKETSLGNQRSPCCGCHRNMFMAPCLWGGKELGEIWHAGGCWGSKGESYKAGGEIRYLAHPIAWSAPPVSGLQSCFSQAVEVRTEFRAVSSCLLVGTWPGFVLFLLLHLHSREAAVDSEHVANTWCCLLEDYHPITGWFLENALCCRASVGRETRM